MNSTGPSRAVIVMAKRPAAGMTKTRLTPALSAQQAADLYEQFLLDTLAALSARTDCTPVIAIDSPDSAAYFSSIAPDVLQVEQVGAALGDRLDAVMSAVLDQGYEQVFALGSDSPDLPATHLDAAFAALAIAENDLVLGPSDDGGYYLIGWKQRWSKVVTDVTMSTPQVFADTLEIAAELGLTVALAPGWYDVDTPADLDRLRASVTDGSSSNTASFLAGLQR
jgi:uncharacterized protein